MEPGQHTAVLVSLVAASLLLAGPGHARKKKEGLAEVYCHCTCDYKDSNGKYTQRGKLFHAPNGDTAKCVDFDSVKCAVEEGGADYYGWLEQCKGFVKAPDQDDGKHAPSAETPGALDPMEPGEKQHAPTAPGLEGIHGGQ